MIELLRGCRDRALGATQVAIVPDGALKETVENHFVVVLHGHTPMDVVQIKCLAAATTALDFIRRKGPGGRVWFVRGEIVHAETGLLTGEAALTEMMSWPGGSIVEVEVPSPRVHTIDMPWSSLLMNVAHAADERKALADAQIVAPVAGVVTQKLVDAGEIVMRGTPIVVVTDLDNAWANLFVPEPMVPRVKLGQPARVVTDAGGEGLSGKVTFISPKAEFTPRNVQTAEERSKLVYRIKVTVDNRAGTLKPGMPVDAELALH